MDTATGAAAFVEDAVRRLPGQANASDDVTQAVGSRPRIVWADDDADMREYVQRLLAPSYEVEVVADCEAALRASLATPPDLVLSDIMMPGMDGVELLRRLRSDHRTHKVPVILLSALAGEESRLSSRETGADDCMTKPFAAREMLARIAVQLELSRVRHAAQLRETELQGELVNVLETMTDGFMALDRESRITYVNAAAERTNRSTREHLLGRTIWEAFPAVLGTEFEQYLRRAMAERVPQRAEGFYAPYGQWFEMDIHPIQHGGLAFYGRDITERKQTEQALRNSENRLRRYFELGLIGMAITSPTKGWLEVNDRLCEILGYERTELLQWTWAEMTHPDDLAAEVVQFERVMRGEIDGYSLDKRFIRKDGRVLEATISVNCVRRQDGSVDYFMALLEDVTERKRSEKALRESEERYRSLISQIRDFAIFSTDECGIVASWNEGCQSVLGYSHEEFIGLDTAELFTAEDRAQGTPGMELRQAREAGTAGIERWMLGRGGHRFFAMGATAALRDSDGRMTGFSTVLRDATQMKESQDELARRGANLERLVSERTGELEQTTKRLRVSERMAALGTLAAGLGHDMGNLLLPMDVRLGLLIEADLPRELHEHVVGIQKCARYLQRLSSGLRLLATDPAHVEPRGATELGRWWGDVHIILKDVLPAGIRFEHHLPESESWVALGRTGLTQSVYNLVQNAADAIKEHGGSCVSVGVENDPSAPWIAVRVTDDGPGMTDEVARRCLEPYFSTKARGESTGMGLALVHAMVTGAGGQVEITAPPGRGTTISLLLPRALPKDTRSLSPDMAGAV